MVEIPECIIVELISIVRDEDLRDSEVANDTFLEEASDIFLHDSGQWFYLDPFDEVVNPYDKELELPYCYGKGPTMSNPHWANGQGVLIGVSSSNVCRMMLLKHWHLSHAFT